MDVNRAVEEPDPRSWKSAMKSKNKAFWLRAAYDEMVAIVTIGVFTWMTELPTGRRALPTKSDLQWKGIDYIQRDICPCRQSKYPGPV